MDQPTFLVFLGCVIPYRLSSYEVSTRKVLKKLGITLLEESEFNCCGTPMDAVNHELALILSARNLCLAEERNLNILTLCNGCFSILNKTNQMLKKSKVHREKINKQLISLGMEFKGKSEIKHLVHVLTEDVGLEKIQQVVKFPLNGLKITQHSGCHLVRPSKEITHGDNPENPEMLKKLIQLTGAESVPYKDETDCCGNPIIGINEAIPFQMAGEKLQNIKDANADALVTVCPFCHMMFDLNQPRIERAIEKSFGIPVLHYSQLLGLAMGFSPEDLLLNELRVKPVKLLEKVKASIIH